MIATDTSSKTFYRELSASRILPKIIQFFIGHPQTSIGHNALFRKIHEDPGAGHRFVRRLNAIGFIDRRGNNYTLNHRFILLPEIKVIYGGNDDTQED